jgi:hypothetical protein
MGSSSFKELWENIDAREKMEEHQSWVQLAAGKAIVFKMPHMDNLTTGIVGVSVSGEGKWNGNDTHIDTLIATGTNAGLGEEEGGQERLSEGAQNSTASSKSKAFYKSPADKGKDTKSSVSKDTKSSVRSVVYNGTELTRTVGDRLWVESVPRCGKAEAVEGGKGKGLSECHNQRNGS